MAKCYMAVRHYADMKRPKLVLEIGNKGLVLATFRNEHAANIWKKVFNVNVALVFENDDIESIDDLLEDE